MIDIQLLRKNPQEIAKRLATRGPGAFDLLQTASAQSPLMRQGCVRHTLWLRDDAGIFADVLVAWLGDAFLVGLIAGCRAAEHEAQRHVRR